MRLVNAQDSTIQDLPPGQAEKAFTSGTHNLNTSEPVFLKSPMGNVGESDPQDVYPSLTQGGYSFATPAEVNDYQMKQKYDTPTGEAESFALGAANSSTFGLGPRALIGLGLLSQEAAQNLPKYNPNSNFAGNIAGITAGVALAPEAEGFQIAKEALDAARAGGDATEIAQATNALKVAKNTLTGLDAINPVSAVNKLGGQITGALSPEGAGFANAALRTAGAAAGSAAEGLAYAGGNINYEDAIGDPTLNSQKVISELGWSAALAGGLGGLLSAGEQALPAAVSTAKDGLSGFKDWALGTQEAPGPLTNAYSKAASWVSGKDPADITGAIFNRFEAAETPEARQALIKETTEHGQNLFDSNEEALKQVNQKIRPIETAQTIPPEAAPAANAEMQRIVGKYDEAIEKIKSDPARYDQGIAKTLETHRDAMLSRLKVDVSLRNVLSGTIPDLQPGAHEVFDAMNKAKQNLDSVSEFGRELTGSERNTVNGVLRPLGNDIRNSLENENIWGQAGARQAAFNNAQSSYFKAAKEFKKYFMQKRGDGSYSSSPSKWASFLNQMTTAKAGVPNEAGAIRREVFQKYLDSSANMIKEANNSFDSITNGQMGIPDALAHARNTMDVAASATKQSADHVSSIKDTFEKQQYAKRLGHGSGLLEGSFIGRIAEGLGIPGHAVYPAVAAFESMKNPGTTISRLSKIEVLVQKATQKIESGAARALKPAADGVGIIIPKIGADISKNQSDHLQKYKEISSNIAKLTANPELFADKIEKSTTDLYPVAQRTTAGVNNSLASGVNFLKSKMPVQNPVGPFEKEPIPSQADVAKFLQYHRAVENPMTILDDLQHNRVSVEGLEAVKSVYPDLLNAMRTQIFSEFGNLKEAPSYQKRLALSMFLGQDMDSSTQGLSVANNQVPFAMKAAGASQQGKPNSKGLSNLDSATRVQTPQEQTSRREEKS